MFFLRNVYSDIHICKEMFSIPFYWIKFAGISNIYVNIKHSTEQWKLTRTRLIFLILSIDKIYLLFICPTLSLTFITVTVFFWCGIAFFVRMRFSTLIVYACISLRIIVRHSYSYDFCWFWNICRPFMTIRLCYSHSFLCDTLIIYTQSPCQIFIFMYHHFHNIYKNEMALVLCILNESLPLLFSCCCLFNA